MHKPLPIYFILLLSCGCQSSIDFAFTPGKPYDGATSPYFHFKLPKTTPYDNDPEKRNDYLDAFKGAWLQFMVEYDVSYLSEEEGEVMLTSTCCFSPDHIVEGHQKGENEANCRMSVLIRQHRGERKFINAFIKYKQWAKQQLTAK